MSAEHPMERHDPRRNDALGLVRRMVRAGTFTKRDLARWKEELGVDAVDEIGLEFFPEKAKKKTAPTTEPVEPEKE